MSKAIFRTLKGSSVVVPTANVSGTINSVNLKTRDLVCGTVIGISQINGSYTITAQTQLPRCLVTNITTTFVNASFGFGDNGTANLVSDFIHPIPNHDITWTHFVIGRDDEQPTFTTGDVRFYLDAVTQTTQSFSGLDINTSQTIELSSSFVSSAGEKIRIAAQRTNGVDGSEVLIVLYGNYTVS